MASPNVFGARTAGASFAGFVADRKVATVYNVPVDATVSKLSAYVAGGASPQSLRAFIYTDADRTPLTRVAQSDPVTIAGGGGSWVDFVLPVPVRLQPGDYWLGLIAGPTSEQAIYYFDQGSLFALRSNADAYSDGASDPWGEETTVAGAKLSINATYTPSDTEPPLCSVTAPANGATVSGNITFSASASDDVGVASVQFLIDGNGVGWPGWLDTSAPYSITLGTTDFPDGSHELSVFATDAAGNVSQLSSVTVTFANIADTVAPVGGVVMVELL